MAAPSVCAAFSCHCSPFNLWLQKTEVWVFVTALCVSLCVIPPLLIRVRLCSLLPVTWSILHVGPFAFATGGYKQEVCCDHADSHSNHCSELQCDSLSIHCFPCSMNNPAVFCIGYAFLLFQDESSVQALIDACIEEDGKLYLCVSSPTIKDKPVSGNTYKRTHLLRLCPLSSVKLFVMTFTWLYE